jgi:DNA-binding phage protein
LNSAAPSCARARAVAYASRVQLTPDGAAVCAQLAEAVRRHGNISDISRRSGIERAALSRALSRGRMSFVTVAAVSAALGLRIRLVDEGTAL